MLRAFAFNEVSRERNVSLRLLLRLHLPLPTPRLRPQDVLVDGKGHVEPGIAENGG
jgi:hypothetical protein